MDVKELNAKLRSDRDWFRDKTELIAVENISTSELEGQVRKNGIQPGHVKELMEDIRQQGQVVPITIDEDYVAVDGNHRLEAFKQLLQEEPDGVWGMIRVYRRTFTSIDEREKYQVKANKHLPSKANTEEDYADLIVKKLHAGSYSDITWDNYNDDSGNYDLLIEKVKQDFAYLKINANTIPKLVRRAVQSAPGSKFKNNMMSALVKAAGCSKQTKWNGTKSKQESNGWWLMTCGSKNHIYPQLAGNSLNRKINNDSISNTVVFNCSNLEGMDGMKLDQWRKDRVADVNRINNANKVLKQKLVDEILFSPHKIESGCEETGLFKVKKKSNRTGDFDLDSVPTSGW